MVSIEIMSNSGNYFINVLPFISIHCEVVFIRPVHANVRLDSINEQRNKASLVSMVIVSNDPFKDPHIVDASIHPKLSLK